MNLRDEFGDIDIYLFDQLLRQRVTPGMRILDAGCGGGRNLVYLLRAGFDVYGVDPSSEAVDRVRALAARVAPHLPPTNFRAESVERLSFDAAFFDFVICHAVLHFADDERHFDYMLDGLWRVLKPQAVLFARLASIKGIEELVVPIHGRRYHLPDGTDRFLIDDGVLQEATERLGGVLLDPIKTVNVQDQRCMTTWCLRKP